ncbi:MAG: TIGR03960 family B12-binding radical SAM protein [Planctomycetaceae bacterium]|nr:TIGR03960 family B12-binding radical SAM protein [Planctomycetaceae bacterium]
MRNLEHDIRSRLLPQVNAPAQYIGLEINARRKDPAAAAVSVALAFPDAYGVGISHLGSQVLYQMLNDMPAVACDRAYCPQPDAETVMRRQNVPLFGWESRCALADFDILGFSLAYELCVTNVLTMLDLAGIPLHADQRGPGDPIVVGGDALADSPEPLADFFDLFLVGDGEGPLRELVELVARLKGARASRDEIIAAAQRTIKAAYAPRFYRAADGPVVRSHLADLHASPPLTRPLVPLAEGVHERVVIEIMRGCPNGCRFCQAGATRLPVRCRSVEEIVAAAGEALAATGYREISLLSLSTSDYPRLDELIERLNAEFAPRHVSISLPSLRVDSQLAQLPKLTSSVRKGGLTIAAEAASERLRRAIRKNITDENMLAGVQAAYAAGWRSVKVYFMAGLPGETPADIDAIFDLCLKLCHTRRAVDGKNGAVSASVSWFVPKPHTPLQWCAMQTAEYFFAVRQRLLDLSHRSPVTFKFHRIEQSILEAVICRGGREVGQAVEAAWRRGARMDSWSEHWDWSKWQEAFAETGIDVASIAQRQIPIDAVLPWSHISGHRRGDFLLGEYQQMQAALAEGPS